MKTNSKQAGILLVGFLMLAVSACSSDSGSADPLTGTRSTAELTTISDEAATNSGIAAADFTAVSADNFWDVDTATGALGSIAALALADAGNNGALKAAKLSVANRMRSSALKARDAVGQDVGQRSQRTVDVDETYTIDSSVPCLAGGKATVTGSVHEVFKATGTETSGTISTNLDIEDLKMVLDGCVTGTWTFWGETLENYSEEASTTYTVSDTAISIGFSVTSNGTLDGGLAMSDGSTHYNFPFAVGYKLTGNGTVPDSSEEIVWSSASISVTYKIGDVTCTLSETDPDVIFSDAGIPESSWKCN